MDIKDYSQTMSEERAKLREQSHQNRKVYDREVENLNNANEMKRAELAEKYKSNVERVQKEAATTENLAKSYARFFDLLKDQKKRKQFHFAYDTGLIQGSLSLERSYLITQELEANSRQTLQEFFEAIQGGTQGDFKAKLGRRWRPLFERSS